MRQIRRWGDSMLLTLVQAVVDTSSEPDMERIMNDYGTGLLRLCYLYLKDYQLAEDALQDTFVNVYQKYHTFRGLSSEKTWITSIAINVCKGYLLKASTRETPDDFSMTAPREELLTEDTVEGRAEGMALLHAVTSLPELYRKVVLLYYYSGFSTIEISKMLKTNNSTVKVRLMRAREMLRAKLGDDFC